MDERLEFNLEKTAEAIVYVAERLNQSTLFFVSKALYYADLNHIENYGLPIAGDNYVAMKHGPVPSGAYDIMKHVRGNIDSRLAKAGKDAFQIKNDKYVIVNRPANIEILSESDIEALEIGISRVNGKSFSQVSNDSHDEAWESADENDFISLDAIASMLKDGELIKEYINSPIPD